tara:strand:+ start:423 stop:836 length:414 start_codon:yes stop_codon:yes gene_type:complete
MSINKILNSLEKSWDRDDILLKIKHGLGNDEIINEFILKNEVKIKELNSLLKPENIDLFHKVEQLLICEAKLISEINNLNNFNYTDNYQTINKKKISLPNQDKTYKISSFMINWSNKFVVIALITISAIALSKQAWA